MPVIDPRLTAPAAPTPPSRAEARPAETGGPSFGERLGDAIRDVDASQRAAETATTDFAEGRSDDLHGTMIALQQADVSLRLAANVRSRALDAYREIMRMSG